MTLRKLLWVLVLTFPLVFSQQSLAAAAKDSDDVNPYDTRNTVGLILISGLVGGVLGLSTLSFYERPQDHIRNITLGAGIGVIASAIYLTATVAATPPPAASNWNLYPAVIDSETYALAFDMRF